MKNFMTAFTLSILASTSFAETKVDLSKLIEAHQEVQECLVLLINGKSDQFGLKLQFEVDSDFYSSENRTLYLKNLGEYINAKFSSLGYNELTADEKKYLNGKMRDSNLQVGMKWGMMSTSSGIASWDKPYRRCVSEYNLAH